MGEADELLRRAEGFLSGKIPITDPAMMNINDARFRTLLSQGKVSENSQKIPNDFLEK